MLLCIDKGDEGKVRQIKFRAWINDSDLFETEKETPYMEYDFAFEEYMTLNDELCQMQVNGFHIMQYTGLKDRNGIEVYESDILHVIEVSNHDDQEYKSAVEYIQSGFLVTEPDGTQVPLCCFHNLENTYPLFEIEIIGNVHKNPEFLAREGE